LTRSRLLSNMANSWKACWPRELFRRRLLERTTATPEIWTVSRCIAEYLRHNCTPVSEIKLLDTIRPTIAAVGTGNLNYDWATPESWCRY